MPVTIVMTQEEDCQPGLHASCSDQQLCGYRLATSATSPASHPRLNVVCVDTIITDSNGNTSRYESKEDIVHSPAHARKGKGRRHSGPSLAVHGVGGTHPGSSPRGSSHSDNGVREGGLDPKVQHGNNWLGVSGGGGSGGGGGGGSGGGSLSTPAKSAPNSRPSSPRPEGRTPRAGKKFRTDRRHSTASASCGSHRHLMSQEAGGRLNVPTLALTADPLAPHAPPNRASSSFREAKAATRNDLCVDDVALGHIRRNSMPNVSNNLLNVPGAYDSGSTTDLTDACGIRRVRSFKTTSKGLIVNRGDSFKKKSTHSLMSTGSTVTDSEVRARGGNNGQLGYGGEEARLVAAGGPAYFRVCMMGAAGVGKTSMAHQFLTSDYVDHDDTDETPQMTVTVLLDGEESTIEFIDPPDRNVIQEGLEQLLDAFVVVFAINDHDSFQTAQQLVRYLRVDYGTDRAILLVANKIDLVRKRKVTADEARMLATTFDCKYAETSAALNHHVDELLVGIITQIRLQLSIPFTTILFPNKESSKSHKGKKALCKGPKGFFYKLFRKGGSKSSKKDKGVENLMD